MNVFDFQALNALLNKRRGCKVKNPSAYLIQALQTCSLDDRKSMDDANKATKTLRPALCQSANQLLSWLHKEGFHPDKLDEASYLYLCQCSPPVQTQVRSRLHCAYWPGAIFTAPSFSLQALTQFLQMWRGGTVIQNPSAYLTKLVNNTIDFAEQDHAQGLPEYSEAPTGQVRCLLSGCCKHCEVTCQTLIASAGKRTSNGSHGICSVQAVCL